MITTYEIIKIAYCYIMDEFDYNPNYRPIAFAYLHAAISQYYNHKFRMSYYENTIPEKKFHFILIASLSPDWSKALEVIKHAKIKHPNTFIIVGGQHITQMPNLLPIEADFGIMGEGEVSLPALLNELSRQSVDINQISQIPGIIYRDKKHNKIVSKANNRLSFENIPLPDYLASNGNKKTPYLLTSRGCPFSCSFCSSSNLWKKVSLQSVESIADNIEFIIKNFPEISILGFWDDLFTINKDRMTKLADELENRGLSKKLAFTCSIRADLLDQQMCDILKRLNVTTVGYGFESGNDRILKILKSQGNISVKKNIEAAKLLKKNNITVVLSVVVGVPTETKKELLDTFNTTLSLVKSGYADAVSYNILSPMPKTHFWDFALKEGLVEESNDFNWQKISCFADYKGYKVKNFDEWYDHRKKIGAIYLNNKTIPEKVFFNILKSKQQLLVKLLNERQNSKKKENFFTNIQLYLNKISHIFIIFFQKQMKKPSTKPKNDIMPKFTK